MACGILVPKGLNPCPLSHCNTLKSFEFAFFIDSKLHYFCHQKVLLLLRWKKYIRQTYDQNFILLVNQKDFGQIAQPL